MSDIKIYTKDDINQMRPACTLAKQTLEFIEPHIEVGITTEELNSLCHNFIVSNGAVPAPLNYRGFPKSICTSVNEVVCHGIPGPYKLKEGDIINVDITVIVDGWHGDTSKTFKVGKCTKLAEKLVAVTEEALYVGINAVKPYGFFNDIGREIQNFVNKHGFTIVRDYCGHGIGKVFHSEPTIVHYARQEAGDQILPGMVFTVEPMINSGTYKTKVLKDGWTAVTTDRSLSAQFEHTIAVTDNAAEILTS